MISLCTMFLYKELELLTNSISKKKKTFLLHLYFFLIKEIQPVTCMFSVSSYSIHTSKKSME